MLIPQPGDRVEVTSDTSPATGKSGLVLNATPYGWAVLIDGDVETVPAGQLQVLDHG